MTHDVDYLGNYPLGNLQSGLIFLINCLRTLKKSKARRFFFKAALRFLSGQVDYYGFKNIRDIAQRQNFKPTFFLFSSLPGENNLNLWERLRKVNPNYSLDHRDMVRALKEISEYGAEIGLHGSYKSANDHTLIEAERKHIEEVTGLTCCSVRQHYLNFYGRTSLDICSRTGLEFDSTCGFVTMNGFLCGTTSPFYATLPHDGGNQVIVIPMIFMDAVPLYFQPRDPDEVRDQLRQMLAYLDEYKGFASVNFHQRMISCFPEYRQLYEDLAIMVKDMGGEIAAITELDRIFPVPLFYANAN